MQCKEVLIGATGTPYVFDLHPLDSPPRATRLVFCIAKRRSEQARERWFILHVGQARGLPADMTEHPRAEEWGRFGASHVGVLPIDDERERLMVVVDLLTALSSPCNGRLPDPEFVASDPRES